MVFTTAHVRQKLAEIQAACEEALQATRPLPVGPLARDVEVRLSRDLPPKPGLAQGAGRARLLHDLASIELQAMELSLRTLCEFPEAPPEFRRQLAELTLDEGRHLALCLDGLNEMGSRWGEWPVHVGLWEAVSGGQDLIDRVLIVHRYLEGSGLDAGEKILQRLSGLPTRDAAWQAVHVIHHEEVGHVDFGSRWFRRLCTEKRLDPDHEYRSRMTRMRRTLPFRTEQVAAEVRRRAGFTDGEILFLQQWRRHPSEESHPSVGAPTQPAD